MKYVLILFFSFTILINAQKPDSTFIESFIWNFSITAVSSYEQYEAEFERHARNTLKVDLREIKKEDILEIEGKVYVIQKPEPSLKGYVEWLNKWLQKNEKRYYGK